MKSKEIREMQIDELNSKINELEEELFNLRFQDKVGQLSNPLRKRLVKRDIARLHTILNEKSAA